MKNLLMVAAAASMMLALGGCDYSDGQRTGTVTKLSKKGIVCKTWEGELAMGGLRGVTDSNGNRGVEANIFLFSVEDGNTEVIESLQLAAETGDRATLVYDQSLIHNPCGQKTSYLITEVRTPKRRAAE